MESILTKVESKSTVTPHELRTAEEEYKTPDQTFKKIKRVLRKECTVCSSKKKTTATMYVCNSCDGSPSFCVECFVIYHKYLINYI